MKEAFSGIQEQFKKIDHRFEKMDRRFDGLEQRFDGLETKVSTQFRILNDRIDDLAQSTKAGFDEVGRRMDETDVRIRLLSLERRVTS